MSELLWVCLGSAVGGGARYLLVGAVQGALGPSFPYGTLAVNLVGSFLMAIVMYAGLQVNALPPTVRVALTAGVMGGFTTYSSFSYETLRALQRGAVASAALNVASTLLGCLAAAALGWALARAVLGPPTQP